MASRTIHRGVAPLTARGTSDEQQQQAVSGKKMLKTEILVEYGVVFPVTLNEDSGIIYTAQLDLQALGQTATPFDLQALLRGDINKVAITTYVQLLREMEVDIIDRETMIGCLRVYSLTEDKNFFEHILLQLFSYWTILSSVLYDPNVSNEIKYDVWQNCPKQVLPRWHLDDSVFMRTWLANPDNKYVTLNGDERLYYIVPDTEGGEGEGEDEGNVRIKRTSYTRSAGQVKIERNDTHIIEYEEGELIEDSEEDNQYFSKRGLDRGLHGSQLYIYKVDDSRTMNVYFNGQEYGPQVMFKDGRLSNSQYYDGSRTVVAYKQYYDSGRMAIANSDITRDGEEIAREEEFYDNEDNSLKFVQEWIQDQESQSTTYKPYGSYYVNLGNHAFSFYTKDGRLTQQLIASDIDDETQHIVYDDNGIVISDTVIDNLYASDLLEELTQVRLS